MCLTVAVIIECAFDKAIADRELLQALDAAKNKSTVKQLNEQLAVMDSDGSGTVSPEEVLNMSSEVQSSPGSLVNMSELAQPSHVLWHFNFLATAGKRM